MTKKLLYGLLMGAALTGFTSCMEVDNFDVPMAKVHGRIIDSTTGQNYITNQDEVHIRIWEKSYSDTPSPQDLSVKADGSYNREHIFAGTYDMMPYDGSWWPCDTIYEVPIGEKNDATQDFTVTPYLKIKDFTVELQQYPENDMDTLEMSCRLFAPITEGLPQVRELHPFLSINQFCGSGDSHLSTPYDTEMRADDKDTPKYYLNIRKMWSAIGDMQTGEGKETYTVRVPVKRGYKYWVRMGANVNDQYQKYNYSEIKEIQVPQ